MRSLSDKLKSLGVQVGAGDLPATPSRPAPALDALLAGQPLTTPQGETYWIEQRYAPDYRHGRLALQWTAPLHVLAAWANEPRLRDLPPEAFAFLDTETTGLSGGTGTYAFLVGVGRFEGGDFHLAQFFMRDPLEEPALLAAVEAFVAPCQAVVTFNGKSFDLPLLDTRFIVQGWRSPFPDLAHVDLLHLARRLWRDRLPSRTLGSLEVQILGALRTEQDVPGWLIPQLYMDYLRFGEVEPLRGVIYHNAMDVVTMPALFNHVAGLLAAPLESDIQHGVDIIALGKLFEDLDDLEMATRLYVYGLEHDLPRPALLEAIQRLAAIHKRQDNLPAAVDLWQQAAAHQHLDAHVELAKYYEHRLGDYPEAIRWTASAIALVNAGGLLPYERQQWLAELQHRLERLEYKLKK